MESTAPPTTQGWPALTWGTDFWTPRDPTLGRNARRRNTGEFRYAITASIAECEPPIPPLLRQDAQEATEALRQFDRDSSAQQWGVPFAAVLLRSESSASSQIEQLTASARRVALASLGDRSSRNAVMVARNTRALQAAIDLADSIGPATLLAMHERLDGGDDPANAGRFRDEWVWIGGASPVTASFVAVRHEQVAPAIDDLCHFARRMDVQPLVQAALAHAQFETVHPFTDGNGRTGRALVSAVLRHRDITRSMSVPISSGLLTDTTSYFNALTRFREGDVEPIIERFCQAALSSITNATALRTDCQQLYEEVMATGQRSTANLRAIAHLCAGEAAFTADVVARTGVPLPSAYRIINRLTERGILREEHKINGASVWSVPALTDALDRFADRAGRRTGP